MKHRRADRTRGTTCAAVPSNSRSSRPVLVAEPDETVPRQQLRDRLSGPPRLREAGQAGPLHEVGSRALDLPERVFVKILGLLVNAGILLDQSKGSSNAAATPWLGRRRRSPFWRSSRPWTGPIRAPGRSGRQR